MTAQTNPVGHWKPKREKPPGESPAANTFSETSSFGGIAPLAIFSLSGCDRQAHFLADGSRQKPAHGVWLPTRRFHEFLACYSARSVTSLTRSAKRRPTTQQRRPRP